MRLAFQIALQGYNTWCNDHEELNCEDDLQQDSVHTNKHVLTLFSAL